MAKPPRRKFSTSASFPAFASSLTNNATLTICLFLHACESAASRGVHRELLMRWREEQLQLGRPRNLDSAPARVQEAIIAMDAGRTQPGADVRRAAMKSLWS